MGCSLPPFRRNRCLLSTTFIITYSHIISQRASLLSSLQINARLFQTSNTRKALYPRGITMSTKVQSKRRSSFCLPFHSSVLKMEDIISQVLSPENLPRIPCFPGKRLKLSLPHNFFLNKPLNSNSIYQ